MLLSSSGSIVTSRLTIAAAVVALCCSFLIVLNATLHHAYSIRPSSLVQLVLAAWVLTDIAIIRTLWLSDSSKALAALAIVLVVDKCLIAIVEELSKRHLLKSPYNAYPPEALSGLLSRLFLCWINPLMWRGIAGKPLSLEDLWSCEKDLTTEVLSERTDTLWAQHLTSEEGPHLFLLLAWEFKWPFLAPTITRIAQACFMFAQPFLIQRTLDWYQSPVGQRSIDVGHGLLGAYALVYCGIAVSFHSYDRMLF